MACPLCPDNSLDPLGYHCVPAREVAMSLMLNVMSSSILSVELTCHHIFKLVVAGVRRVQGPVQQTSLSQLHLSSLRCHSYISTQFYCCYGSGHVLWCSINLRCWLISMVASVIHLLELMLAILTRSYSHLVQQVDDLCV